MATKIHQIIEWYFQYWNIQLNNWYLHWFSKFTGIYLCMLVLQCGISILKCIRWYCSWTQDTLVVKILAIFSSYSVVTREVLLSILRLADEWNTSWWKRIEFYWCCVTLPVYEHHILILPPTMYMYMLHPRKSIFPTWRTRCNLMSCS